MLSSELELASIDARHWRNWWRLLAPPGALDAPKWAIAIVERGQLLKLIGAPAQHYPGAHNHEAWARRLGVSALLVIERGVIAQLSQEIEAALKPDQDYVAQGLVALKALKRHANKGLWTVPSLLDVLPTPTYEPIQRTFDLLVPDGSSLVMYVVENDRTRLHSSIIAVKDGGDITRAATHRGIADLVPEAALAKDWQKQYKRVLAAVEERYAKPSVAIFVERATLMKVLTGPSDTLAREYNAKTVIIDPVPAWLMGLFGGAAVAAMLGRGLAALLPSSVQARAKEVASKISPWSQLGFDPIELWSRLKHFYR